jgi:polysaccharide biosynthesis transport protein
MNMASQIVASGSPAEEAVGEPGSVPVVLHLVELARRHLLLIIGIVATALISALVLTLLATPQYTAETRIEIAREQANVTNVEGLQSDNFVQTAEFYTTQHALLGARSLAERVTRRLRLAQNDAFLEATGIGGDAGLLDGGQSARPTREQLRQREQQAADALLSGISIDPLRTSALVDISYTSANPELSAQIANAWAQEFIRQSMDRRFGSTSDARTYLETRLEGLRQRLVQSERELNNYARSEGIVPLTSERSADGRTVTTQTLVSANVEALNNQLAAATAERIAAEGRRDAARTRGVHEVTLANGTIIGLRERRADLAAQYAQLMQRFEPEYPEALALQRQIANLEASIVTEERRVLTVVDGAYDAAARREQGLRARVEGLLGQLDSQNAAQIQYNIFQREVDSNRTLYDGLLERYKEIGVAGVGTNNIAIVDEARVPGGPSSPNLLLNLVLGVLVGMAIAATAVFAIENLDEAIRRPQQITDTLKVPLLGAVPVVNEDEPSTLLADPKSTLSEAYMTVRTNLGFTTDHGAPRSLSVTSTSPSEGKSTSSLAIANALGRTGKRVILIDLDLRRPAMARALGLSRTVGVSNYLSGDDGWQAMVQATSYANLHFMASGPMPPSAPELLSGDRLAQLISQLGTAYDHVVIDGPPMLELADAQLIARNVEGIIFVVEAGRTPIRAVEATLKRLRENGNRLFGIVLTKYRAQTSTYGYGYKYSNQYNYGADS